jgi:predicted membrane protein
METKNTNHKTSAGIIVLVLGLILLLNNFDWIQFPVKHYIFSWKTLLIGIGGLLIVAREKYASGIFLIGLGLIFWLPEIFHFRFTLHQIFWPALLIVVGTVILLKAIIPFTCGRHRHEVSEAEIVSLSESRDS